MHRRSATVRTPLVHNGVGINLFFTHWQQHRGIFAPRWRAASTRHRCRMERKIDILVLSDLHLGTYGCRARELAEYLRGIKPGMVILNGDIIDIWQFKKSYFPKSHMRVVKRLLKLATKVPVYYITGNHDEALRRYSPAVLGGLQLVDRLDLEVDGERYWFFHGDIFDASN